MKKCKKQAGKRQQRSKRSSQKALAGVIPSLGSQIRAGLLAEIQKGVVRLAAQLVEDEVHDLVGAPWSRKGDSASLPTPPPGPARAPGRGALPGGIGLLLLFGVHLRSSYALYSNLEFEGCLIHVDTEGKVTLPGEVR